MFKALVLLIFLISCRATKSPESKAKLDSIKIEKAMDKTLDIYYKRFKAN